MQLFMQVVTYAIQWVVESAFLLLALWAMVKIQKLQFTFHGLVLSAAIASGFDLIPFVGHYIALAALWICLTKVTREDFTGVAFTAAIAYALVFGMNLFLLGTFIGDLRASARAPTATDDLTQIEFAGEEDFEDQSDVPVAREQPAAAPAPRQPEPAVEKKPLGFQPEKVFVVKGLTQNGKQSMVILSVGRKTHTLALGETILADTPEGKMSLRLDKVKQDSILLDIAGHAATLPTTPIH